MGEMKFKQFGSYLLSLSFILMTPLVYSGEDPQAIVKQADMVRFPSGSYEFEVVITTYEGDEKKSENGYRVSVQDIDHALAQFISPASEKGKSTLMIEEDLWIYLPNVKKPIRIPFQQRLIGDVSNGDMVRANLANDYTATLEGEEMIEGKATYILDLVAKSENKTYNKIKYWVLKENNWPVKAEYFTVSGRSLKTCVFEDFRLMAGAVRPLRFIFNDSLDKSKKSVMIFKEMRKKKFDDSMFTKDYMKTLE